MCADRVRLADVADRAGVSRTTASYVTTGRTDMRISAEAAQRVHSAARELGYRPSLLARGLRTQLTHTIGFVSDVIATEPYAGALVRGATAAALEGQTLMLVGESGGDPEVERRLVQSMLDRGVDGFLYASMYTKQVQLPAVLRGHRVVLVNCVGRRRGPSSVVPDEIGGGRSAAQLLLDAGHRDRIVLVGETPPDVIAGRQRLAGVTAALDAAGARLAEQVDALLWPDSGYVTVRRLLRRRARPSALICLNDRIALGAYQAVADAGLAVPHDISVVSFDGSDLAGWLRPELASVAIPHLQLGARGAELLLDRELAATQEQLPMPVRIGASVSAPSA
ncbi:MAG TPA: LacI family DNA-binding transcriptional regulator [Jatrophihabitans sp.]|uniref:LacI family DNA-binding transcriptional regulator n=1 Tax=Jatrophihabitans sp. TaxID=1932789 RepID=UPI002E09EB1F|nr:LacI family DNA-binding transcriptional regulator [Jatrophihabitans sp.]